MYDSIPQELKKLKCWVNWRGDKLPKNPRTGNNAMSNNPDTWGTYEEAITAIDKFGMDGIGFMFHSKFGYFGVDLDHCIENTDFVDEFVETLQSYTEYSRSGNGIHIICKGKLPEGAKRRGNVEMYCDGRYFIMTGKIYNENYATIKDCSESIKVLRAKYLADTTPQVAPKPIQEVSLADNEIIDKARNCKTGMAFQLLYDGNWQGTYASQSEADLSLCSILAFWTQRDRGQIDRIFRSSGLYRAKWDKKHGSMTYGNMTIEKAVSGCNEVYEPNKYDDDTSIALGVFGKIATPQASKTYDMNDTGNAQRFRDKFVNQVHYSFVNKRWSYWNGETWMDDETGEIKRLGDTIIADIKKEAISEQDEDRQEEALKWANKTASSKNKEAMIKESQHLEGIPILPNEMDKYHDYLNCQNGIINLRNGELIKHDSSLNMSKICLCEYDPSDKKPQRWLQFLDEVCGGNQELIHYLQKAIGYTLTGSIQEQCCFFLYGMGNNGKSTFMRVLSDMLGSYSSNAQPETIMMKKSDDNARGDIARLKSVRFVSTEEATEGVRLNEGLLKQLTGGGKITCRFLYGNDFEYEPEFKIWFATNHKPRIVGTDNGIWRRIRLIPFEVSIPEDKVDKNLPYKLREELPQILHWAVEGCMMWQKEGLGLPKVIMDATKEYRNEMDLLATFIENCVVIDYTSSENILAGTLFQIYCSWAKQNNEYEMTNRKFISEMTKKLPEKKRLGDGIHFPYIRLNDYGKSLIEYNYRASDFK